MLVGQVEGLKDVREGCVPASDTGDGSFQVQEALLLDHGSQFSAKSVGQWSLVGDQDAACLLGGLEGNDKGISNSNW